jgi:hypothetical protein
MAAARGIFSARSIHPLIQGTPIKMGLVNVPEPTTDSSAATKLYVDTHGGGGGTEQLRIVYLSTAGSASPTGLTLDAAFGTLETAAAAANSLAASHPVVIVCMDAGVFTPLADVVLNHRVSLYAPNAVITGTQSLTMTLGSELAVDTISMSGNFIVAGYTPAGSEKLYSVIRICRLLTELHLNIGRNGQISLDADVMTNIIVTEEGFSGVLCANIHTLGSEPYLTSTITNGNIFLTVKILMMNLVLGSGLLNLNALAIYSTVTSRDDPNSTNIILSYNWKNSGGFYHPFIENPGRIYMSAPYELHNGLRLSGLWGEDGVWTVGNSLMRLGVAVHVNIPYTRLTVPQNTSENQHIVITGDFSDLIFKPTLKQSHSVKLHYTPAAGGDTIDDFGTLFIDPDIEETVTIYNHENESFTQFAFVADTLLEIDPIVWTYDILPAD